AYNSAQRVFSHGARQKNARSVVFGRLSIVAVRDYCWGIHLRRNSPLQSRMDFSGLSLHPIRCIRSRGISERITLSTLLYLCLRLGCYQPDCICRCLGFFRMVVLDTRTVPGAGPLLHDGVLVFRCTSTFEEVAFPTR